MAEYKKMKLEDVFADIERIMGADASDEEKSMQLRKKPHRRTSRRTILPPRLITTRR